MSILQITDIHINGDYNGQFDVKKHFKQILEANKKRDFAAIALTGDLADEGSYEDYAEIFNQVEETFGNGTPILAIPGNHDNREHLDLAYMDYINREHNFKPGTYLQRIGGTFEEPGKCVVILTLPGILAGSGNTKLIGMDNAHKELPHQGLEAFLDHEWNRKNADSYTLFMHMPLIKPFHRFMNVDAHSIDEDAAKTFLWGLREFDFRGIICGHYHCASVTNFNDFVQFVAPASQCQLDPFAKDCSPSGNYPGYAIICPGMHQMHMCKFHYIVEDENGLSRTKMATKYRIVKREWFDTDDKLHVRFEPQYRFLGIFWCGFSDHDCDSSWNRHFREQKEAEAFLAEVERMGGTEASTVVAEY